MLDRDSVQSSIHRQLSLGVGRRASPAEAGIAEMMVGLYQTLASTLDHETLFAWHRMVMNGRRDLADIVAEAQQRSLAWITHILSSRRRRCPYHTPIPPQRVSSIAHQELPKPHRRLVRDRHQGPGRHGRLGRASKNRRAQGETLFSSF